MKGDIGSVGALHHLKNVGLIVITLLLVNGGMDQPRTASHSGPRL